MIGGRIMDFRNFKKEHLYRITHKDFDVIAKFITYKDQNDNRINNINKYISQDIYPYFDDYMILSNQKLFDDSLISNWCIEFNDLEKYKIIEISEDDNPEYFI